MELANRKTVFIVSSLSGGGAERISAELCNYLHRHNFNVSILETEEHGEAYAVDSNIKVTTLGCSGVSKSGVPKRLFRMCKFFIDERPDVIISLGYAFKYLDILGVYNHASLVLSERNYPLATYSAKAMEQREKLFLRAEKVIFQTPEAAACYGEAVRLKSTVIPNPLKLIPIVRCSPVPRIVTACRFVPQKNVSLLLSAFAVFLNTHLEYTLDIYGEGPMEGALRKRAEELGISDSVRFLPFSKTLHSDIADAAMFVSSSDFEGLQNALMEAMGMGIPSIATDCLGGGARLITDGGNRALLVPRGDARALAAAMARIADNPEFASELSARGKELIRLFSAAAICEQWYNYIVSESPC